MGPSIVYLKKASYAALDPKVETNIYVCEDTHELFKGSTPIRDAIQTVNELPAELVEGTLYNVNGNLYFTDGMKVVDVTKTIVDQISVEFDPREHVKKSELREALYEEEEKVPELSLDGLYEQLKLNGYNGTKKTFLGQLAEILNHTEVIVINEDEGQIKIVVGDEEYASVDEALAAVEANGSVDLVASAALSAPADLSADGITVSGEGVVLDANNNTVTLGNNAKFQNVSIVNNAIVAPADNNDLLLVDGKTGVVIEDSDIATETSNALVLDNGAQVSLNGVSIFSSADPEEAAGRYDSKSLVWVCADSELTMPDGEIIANTSSADDCGLYGITFAGDAKAVIGDQATGVGPVIKTNSAPFGSNHMQGGMSDITIYGGEFRSTMSHTGFMGVFYMGASMKLEVFDGIFDGGNYDIGCPYKKCKYDIAIHGGEWDGKSLVNFGWKGDGPVPHEDPGLTVVVDGGSFAYQIPDEWLGEHCVCEKDDNGRWVVRVVDSVEVSGPSVVDNGDDNE